MRAGAVRRQTDSTTASLNVGERMNSGAQRRCSVELASDRLRRAHWVIQTFGLVDDVNVLVEHALDAAVDAMVEDIEPVGALAVGPADDAHDLRPVEHVPQRPRNAGSRAPDLRVGYGGTAPRDPRYRSQSDIPEPADCLAHHDLHQVIGTSAQPCLV